MTFITEPREALQSVVFLRHLPEEAMARLLQAGRAVRYAKGETLFLETDACRGLFVVLMGAVKVYRLDSRGRELILDLEEPGESVVELPLFDGGNYPANAEAFEENTTLWFVPREAFRALMADYPQIATQGLKAQGVRMRKLMQMLEAQALQSVRMRLAAYLLQVAEGRETFRLTETNEFIGNQIGTVREVVSRTLRSLAEAGAISLRGREVAVRDAEKLRQLAEE